MDEPHSGQKWRRIGLPLSARLLNGLTIPRILRTVLGRPTMMPNALPVNFLQSRQWHTLATGFLHPRVREGGLLGPQDDRAPINFRVLSQVLKACDVMSTRPFGRPKNRH